MTKSIKEIKNSLNEKEDKKIEKKINSLEERLNKINNLNNISFLFNSKNVTTEKESLEIKEGEIPPKHLKSFKENKHFFNEKEFNKLEIKIKDEYKKAYNGKPLAFYTFMFSFLQKEDLLLREEMKKYLSEEQCKSFSEENHCWEQNPELFKKFLTFRELGRCFGVDQIAKLTKEQTNKDVLENLYNAARLIDSKEEAYFITLNQVFESIFDEEERKKLQNNSLETAYFEGVDASDSDKILAAASMHSRSFFSGDELDQIASFYRLVNQSIKNLPIDEDKRVSETIKEFLFLQIKNLSRPMTKDEKTKAITAVEEKIFEIIADHYTRELIGNDLDEASDSMKVIQVKIRDRIKKSKNPIVELFSISKEDYKKAILSISKNDSEFLIDYYSNCSDIKDESIDEKDCFKVLRDEKLANLLFNHQKFSAVIWAHVKKNPKSIDALAECNKEQLVEVLKKEIMAAQGVSEIVFKQNQKLFMEGDVSWYEKLSEDEKAEEEIKSIYSSKEAELTEYEIKHFKKLVLTMKGKYKLDSKEALACTSYFFQTLIDEILEEKKKGSINKSEINSKIRPILFEGVFYSWMRNKGIDDIGLCSKISYILPDRVGSADITGIKHFRRLVDLLDEIDIKNNNAQEEFIKCFKGFKDGEFDIRLKNFQQSFLNPTKTVENLTIKHLAEKFLESPENASTYLIDLFISHLPHPILLNENEKKALNNILKRGMIYNADNIKKQINREDSEINKILNADLNSIVGSEEFSKGINQIKGCFEKKYNRSGIDFKNLNYISKPVVGFLYPLESSGAFNRDEEYEYESKKELFKRVKYLGFLGKQIQESLCLMTTENEKSSYSSVFLSKTINRAIENPRCIFLLKNVVKAPLVKILPSLISKKKDEQAMLQKIIEGIIENVFDHEESIKALCQLKTANTTEERIELTRKLLLPLVLFLDGNKEELIKGIINLPHQNLDFNL